MERKRARLRQNDDRCGLDPLEMVTDATIRRQDTRASLYGPVEEHKVAAVCMCAWNSYMILNTSRIRIRQHNKTWGGESIFKVCMHHKRAKSMYASQKGPK